MNHFLNLLLLLFLGIAPAVNAQTDSIRTNGLSLPELVDFALQNSPGVLQSELDQQIGEH